MENSSIRRQWLDSYQSHLLEEEHIPQTIRKYIHDIAFFFSFLPAEAEISKEKVLAYKQELIQKYRPASANSMLVALNGFLSYIGLAQCRVRLFKLQRRSFRSPEKDLTRQEYERLVKAAKSHRNERLSLLLQTICSTGIRVSEHRFVTVEALQTGQVQISNKGKMRVIILPRELRGLLLQFCKKKRLTTGPVFVTRTGKPMNRTNIWCMMKRLCAQAHVDSQKVFPHNLRHLFALTFYRMEKDIVRLADILGHSSIETTRIYTLTSSTEHAKAISRLHLLI